MDLKQLKQSNIKTASTINVALWDAAKWRGVAFIYDYGINLMLLPVFENISAGKQIFEQWIKEIGNDDTEDYIKIGIIKGINKENPCHYRVVFSPNIDTLIKDNQGKCIIHQCRFHTMDVNNNQNIKMFEEAYKKLKVYWICPVEIKNSQIIPNDLLRIRKTNIEIKEAWEIDETSFMSNAILPSDNPMIPSNISDVPIFNVFKRIKESQKFR